MEYFLRFHPFVQSVEWYRIKKLLHTPLEISIFKARQVSGQRRIRDDVLGLHGGAAIKHNKCMANS